MIKKSLLLSLIVSLALMGSSVYAMDENSEYVENGAIEWPEDQVLPTFTKAKHLDVADIHDSPGEIKILLTTLQGVINQQKPRIYVQQDKEDPWLKNDLKIPYTLHDDAMDVLKKYADEINGIIVYDPEIPDSINVATTLAGLKGAVVASPELAEQLTSEPYNLRVLEDLQGKFKDRMDAYTWQYENLWSQTTHRMLVGLPPDTSIPLPPDNFDSFETIATEEEHVTDASNRKTYELDVSSFLGEGAVYLRFNDSFPQDGYGPAVHKMTVKADGETITQFKTGSPKEKEYLYDTDGSKFLPDSDHRFADNGNYFVYEFNPPEGTEQMTISVEMWNQYKVSASNVRPQSSAEKEPFSNLRDYAVANKAMVFQLSAEPQDPEEKELFERILSDVKTGVPYLGWFKNDFEGEAAGIDLTSKHGVFVLASDFFDNMTIFSGTERQEIQADNKEAPELENKIYVTYTVGEGDNLQYDQGHMRTLWDDSARGEVPINWTSSPMLYDAAPAILNYYQQTATENDLLVAGPSGAAYFSPHVWPKKEFPDLLRNTHQYLEKSGLSYPYVLNRDVTDDVPLSESQAAAYERYYNVPGMFLGGGDRTGIEILNSTLPVSYLPGISTVQQGKDILADIKEEWDGKSPKFISLGINAWNMRISDVQELDKSLGSEYESVLANQYFSLVRKAKGLPKNEVTLLDMVEQFEDEGEITDTDSIHLLKLHLNAIEHFKKEEKADKVVKHLKGFKQLLDYQKEYEFMSEKAYDLLQTKTNSLIKQWEL